MQKSRRNPRAELRVSRTPSEGGLPAQSEQPREQTRAGTIFAGLTRLRFLRVGAWERRVLGRSLGIGVRAKRRFAHAVSLRFCPCIRRRPRVTIESLSPTRTRGRFLRGTAGA